MVTGFVSDRNVELLQEEGYRILHVPFIHNPFWPYDQTKMDGRYPVRILTAVALSSLFCFAGISCCAGGRKKICHLLQVAHLSSG